MKKTLLLIAMYLSIAGTKVFAYDIAVENADGVTIYYTYSTDGKDLVVTSGSNKYTGAVVIPEEIAYMNRTRKVTTIGEKAFYECTDLTSVTIPESVTTIQQMAFAGCTGLTSVTIPKSITFCLHAIFQGCTGLTSVTISEGVTEIGTFMFSGCTGLTSITIPQSVTRICYGAFYNCTGLTSFTVPSNVRDFGEQAFHGCNNIKSVNISDLDAWCRTTFGSADANPLSYAHQLYLNGKEVTQVEFPEDITTVGDYLFYSCKALTSVTIPTGVTRIGACAFYGCSGLTSVVIPPDVTVIDGGSFAYCTGLTSITIPSKVDIIGGNAFRDIDLISVTSLIKDPQGIQGKESSNRTFSTNTFNNATLYIPAASIEKYKVKNGWKDFLFVEPLEGQIVKCATPIIQYIDGRLICKSATEGSKCVTTILAPDAGTYEEIEIPLKALYSISVIAQKDGYADSDPVTATLYWMEKELKPGEVEVNAIRAKASPVIVSSTGNTLSVQGAEDGESITAYTLEGKQLGSAICRNGSASLSLATKPADIVVVKVGESAIKVRVR